MLSALPATRRVGLSFVLIGLALLAVAFLPGLPLPLLLAVGIGAALLFTAGRDAPLGLGVYLVCLVYAAWLLGEYQIRYHLPYFQGGGAILRGDDLMYETWGQQAAQSLDWWEYGQIVPLIVGQAHNSPGYIWIVSELARFTTWLGGEWSPLLPKILNAALIGWAAILTARIGRATGLLSDRAATLAGALLGLSPAVWYWGAAHTFREALVMVLLLLPVYASARFWRGQWAVYAACIAALFTVRPAAAAVLLGLAGLLAFGRLPRDRVGVILRGLVGTVVVAAGVGLLVLLYRGGQLTAALEFQQGYDEYRADLAPGLSGLIFALPEPLKSVGKFAAGFIFPFPVTTNPEDVWNTVGIVVNVLLLPFVLRGFLALWRTPYRPLLLFGLAAWGLTTVVTFSPRQIITIYPVLYLCAAVGLHLWPHRVRTLAYMTTAAGVMGSVFLLVK